MPNSWATCRRTSPISGQAPRAGYLGQKCEAYFVGRPGEKDPYLAFPAGIAEVRGNKRLEMLAKFNQRFTGDSTDERLGLHRRPRSTTPSS